MADERLRLVAELQNKASAELRRLTKDFDSVKPTTGMNQVKNWFTEFETISGRTEKAIKPLAGGLSMIGVSGLAAGLSITGLISQFRDLAKALPALQELSRLSGISKTEIERLKQAAANLNVDPSKMSAAISTWSTEMVQFRRHTGALYAEMMNGSSGLARKIASEDPAQGFKDMLDWLNAIPAAQMRAGKSAADAAQIQKHWTQEALGDGDLSQIFAKGQQGWTEAYAKAAQDVGQITDEVVKQAEALDRAVAGFDASWKSFERDVGPYVFKELTAAADDFRSVFDDIKSATSWFQAHKDHPVHDALKATDDDFDQHAADAGARYRGEKPWGLGLPKTWTDDVGLTDPDKPSDGSYSITMPAIGGFFKRALGAFNPVSAAHSEEAPPARNPIFTPNVWSAPSAYDREARARGAGFRSQVTDTNGNALRRRDDELSPVTAQEMFRAPRAPPSHPDEDRLSRARASEFNRVTDTDGNALRRHDDELSPVTAQDLFRATQDGSKAGTIAAWREMLQQQDLQSGSGGGPGIGQDGGSPSIRYGRGASGAFRSAPGTGGGAPLGQGAVGGVFKGGRTVQAGLAKESYDFWRSKGLDHNAALSMVSQEQGESGFDFRQKRGDSGQAHGAFSWHSDRRAAIQRGTGIDIDSADHKQQLEAAWYEGTKGMRAGFFQSLNGRSLQDAVYQGVHRFEGSKYQMADTAKRVGMARAWDGGGSFLAPKPTEATPPPAAAPSASAGPKGAYPGWMDDKSRREMAGVNTPLARDLIAASESTGSHFRILQGLRTQDEANANARRGVGVRNSQHLYGAAADIKLTDAAGHDLDRNDPAYGRFADAYEAHSRSAGGKGRWLGHVPGWSWDRAHFDQGIGYGQSHARDPYGAGGPTKDDISAGNREIFGGPDNPFTKAARPLSDAAQKLKAAVSPLPAAAPEPPPNPGAGMRAEIDPVRLDIHHHENGRTSIAAKAGKGVQISLKTGPTLVRTA